MNSTHRHYKYDSDTTVISFGGMYSHIWDAQIGSAVESVVEAACIVPNSVNIKSR